MAQLQSITRILVLGKTKREGPSLKCLSDKSSLRLILSSSLDGKLWSPFGTYNQVHDRLTEVFETNITNPNISVKAGDTFGDF